MAVFVVKMVMKLDSEHRDSKIVSSLGRRAVKKAVSCRKVIDAWTTLNEEPVK